MGSTMHVLVYDFLNDLVLLGVLALGFCMLYAVVLVVEGTTRLFPPVLRKIGHHAAALLSIHPGFKTRFFFGRTHNGHGRP
jgi:hypothetical protein